MLSRLSRVFSGTRIAVLASCVSVAIGLLFIFVRAPHPWGWEGFDRYRELGLTLARGGEYPTLERLWGYPYFLALFYKIFGDRQWIPLTAQALLNATIPLMIFVEARRQFDTKTASLAALITGIFSFNTIYASTQAADALCTVWFVASLVCYSAGSRSSSAAWFALSGAFAGLALLFRPNLLLFPVCLAAVDAALRRRRGWRMQHLVVYLVTAAAVWLPWPIRNYRLTDRFIPATTHGGIQLWYGSLQAGEYFERWFDNPRAQLESSPFDYSLPATPPIVVVAKPAKPSVEPRSVTLTYWTSRDSARTNVRMERSAAATFQSFVPAAPSDTVLYYFIDATWTGRDGEEVHRPTPPAGGADPFRHVITNDHFGDLDFGRDTLDLLDVARLVDHVTWQQPVPHAELVDLDRDGSLTRRDLDYAAGVLVAPAGSIEPNPGAIADVSSAGDRVTLRMRDGSSLTLPRALTRTIDVDVEGSDRSMAANLIRSARSFVSLKAAARGETPLAAEPEFQMSVEVNKIFSRSEPLWMDRYTQLALANIREAPGAFVAASARRLLRMSFVLGSDDRFRAAQFAYSRYVYAVATVVSVGYALLFVAGAVIVWRRTKVPPLLLLSIVYIPVTICVLLPNMRYMVTAQPLMFVFVAVALTYNAWRAK